MNRSNCIRSPAISVPDVFAAGDVRAGAMNRVASAVGEGSMVVPFAHEYLALT
jgi:thioredoxin reductase (NADPH)